MDFWGTTCSPPCAFLVRSLSPHRHTLEFPQSANKTLDWDQTSSLLPETQGRGNRIQSTECKIIWGLENKSKRTSFLEIAVMKRFKQVEGRWVGEAEACGSSESFLSAIRVSEVSERNLHTWVWKGAWMCLSLFYKTNRRTASAQIIRHCEASGVFFPFSFFLYSPLVYNSDEPQLKHAKLVPPLSTAAEVLQPRMGPLHQPHLHRDMGLDQPNTHENIKHELSFTK